MKVQGIDVSYAQGPYILWPGASGTGMGFAFMKASEGYAVDAQFGRNIDAANKTHLLTGAYHFYRSGKKFDVAKQAETFLKAVDGRVDLPLVVDLENSLVAGEWNEFGVAERNQRLQAFLEILENATGRPPIIYSNRSFLDETKLIVPGKGQKHPFWVAAYATSYFGAVPKEYANPTFWQYTGEGVRLEMNIKVVDQDYFMGSAEQLWKFAGIQPYKQSKSYSPKTEAIQIALIKRALLTTPDGFFGPKTEKAVKDFQASINLPVTGEVNCATWVKLFAVKEN